MKALYLIVFLLAVLSLTNLTANPASTAKDDTQLEKNSICPLGEIIYNMTMNGPIIRKAKIKIIPVQKITTDNWDSVREQALPCLANLLREYSFPFTLEPIPGSSVCNSKECSAQYIQFQLGFSIRHPLHSVKMSYDFAHTDKGIVIELNYFVKEQLNFPPRILTPAAVMSVIVSGKSVAKHMNLDDTNQYNGKTNYYPAKENNNKKDLPSLTLCWFDNPNDEQVHFALVYVYAGFGSIDYYDALKGEKLLHTSYTTQ